ncbi:MAG TPA: hypothetical protein VHM19_18130, partial [Polyangiales bacterium]|nr:hypothetical protein [Polyangiales bacterium]
MLEQSAGGEGPTESQAQAVPPSPQPEASTRAEPSEASLHEVDRLEDLLSARSRERGELQRELARTSALLRDALARFAELPSRVAVAETALPASEPASSDAPANEDALSRLRAERDAATAQALEAEASRAEIAFRLDEALGHLLAEQSARADDAAQQGTIRGLRARAAEAEEALSVAEARLMLGEQDLNDARERARRAQADLQLASERFELDLLRERTAADAARAAHAEGEERASALRGERDGLAARGQEAELALQTAYARVARAEHALSEANDKLARVRAEHAEGAVRIQALTARLVSSDGQLAARADGLRGVLAELRSPLRELASAVH